MTVLEIAWTALAVLGVYLSVLNSLESWRDYQALMGKQNGRRTIAIGNIRREVVRVTISGLWLVIGAFAIVAPNRTEEINPVAVVLVATSAGMALNSYLDRRDRLYLMTNGMQPRDEAGRFVKDE